MDKEYRTFQFRIDNVGRESGELSGYATVFEVINEHYNEVFHKGAFAQTIRHTGGKVPIILEHFGPWIGMNREAREDDYGLFVDGQLAIKSNRDAQGVHELALLAAEVGRPAGISIGFSSVKREVDEDAGLTHQREVRLWEWSLCPPGFQSLDQALVTDVRMGQTAIRQFLSTDAGRTFLLECFRDMGIKQPALEAAAATQGATPMSEAHMHSISEALEALAKKF